MDTTWLTYALLTLNILMLIALTAIVIFAYYFYQDLKEIQAEKQELKMEIESWKRLISAGQDKDADLIARSYDYPNSW